MPAAILDTNAVSDLMRDHATFKLRLSAQTEPVTTSVVVIGELRYGLDRLPIGKKRTDLEARAHAIVSVLSIDAVTVQIGDTYGHLKAQMQSQGVNMDDNDLWIAATAIANGSRLVTRDAIFASVPGLHVEDWTV